MEVSIGELARGRQPNNLGGTFTKNRREKWF